jgi:hypothetical protein
MRDLARKQQFWTIGELQFNNCLLYLQVKLISDVMIADGKGIPRNIWQGIKDQCHDNYSKQCFVQPKPGNTALAIWKRILRTLYNCNEYGTFHTQRQHILKSPQWKWFLHQNTERLYKQTSNQDQW